MSAARKSESGVKSAAPMYAGALDASVPALVSDLAKTATSVST